MAGSRALQGSFVNSKQSTLFHPPHDALMRAVAAAGDIIVFDRSRYNRVGVEHVTGFATSGITTRRCRKRWPRCRNARTSINMTAKRRSKAAILLWKDIDISAF
jgi:hypothetical protein